MICNCVDHLCTKIMVPVLLMSCSFFYCGHSRFKIHNLWKNRLDIVHVCKLWGILWNCISSASRIWFYLGVYVELRPICKRSCGDQWWIWLCLWNLNSRFWKEIQSGLSCLTVPNPLPPSLTIPRTSNLKPEKHNQRSKNKKFT